ncbi:MAG TPA: metallophosphoesterase family protein [Bryobacteraceae bacterium]|nr:metallophosphoesterase family protein [Bryobacteraceae bacterium]
MRIAVVSDIHGNRTAFDAVLADLRLTSPDLILHGGDLADDGASPVEIVDHIRDLGWPGVIGNGEEALSMPETLEAFASQSSAPPALWTVIRELMDSTRALLGDGRLAWLRSLPRTQLHGPMALVHASPETSWRSPMPEASDAELQSVYGPLGRPIAVYGHIHRSYIRNLAGMIVANAGSVSLSHDGDRRAAYLLLDNETPSIRRVEYDLNRELKDLSGRGLPHADWIAKILESGRPQMP